MRGGPREIAIVVPVFNDWEAFIQLLHELDSVFAGRSERSTVIAVDDGSTEELIDPAGISSLTSLVAVDIISLVTNLGHQRAIVVGLCEANRRKEFDAVVVMDADGQDRPSDVLRMIDEAVMNPGKIIVARRTRRHEGRIFRVCYKLYKLTFRLMTGRQIDFGHFCLIPMEHVEALLHIPSSWNNIAAAISVSSFPVAGLRTDRGRRFGGTSRMSFMSLVIHGFSAMSVYTDIIVTRLIVAALFMLAVLVTAIAAVVAIRLLTELAIPGWATTVFGLLLVLIMQVVVLGVGALFFLLSQRSVPPALPIHVSSRFVKKVNRLGSG